MRLHALLQQLPLTSLAGIDDLEITGIEDDSRRVKAGCLFIARSGTKLDGRGFMADAAARGAVAAVVQQPIPTAPLPQIVIDDAGAGARLAHLFHGDPSRQLMVLGVTGTNGKTTTTYMVRQLLTALGRSCGLIGTVQICDGLNEYASDMTTPGAVELASLLGRMRANACAACAMEVSSHALDQGRARGVRFAGAAFTNLTRDHLDYHQTMEQYAQAKAKLFTSLESGSVAAVNIDDPWAACVARDCGGARLVRWGFGPQADYRAEDVRITAAGSRFNLITPNGQALVKMRLVGKYNVANALAAATLVGEAGGVSAAGIAGALAMAEPAPGRLQVINGGQPFTVVVDYAHTDDALRNVLQALRPLTRGKLRVLFGCGGDRDRTKRPLMGRVAEELADAIYITSDNPRTEEPSAIIAQITAGLSGPLRGGQAADNLVIEEDRRCAIERILADAQPEDVVVLAGKGHENYQIVGTEKRHFDDVEEVQRCLRLRAA